MSLSSTYEFLRIHAFILFYTRKVPWSDTPNNWFVELPYEDVVRTHSEKYLNCESFWGPLFEN